MMPSAPNVVSETGFSSVGVTWKIGIIVLALFEMRGLAGVAASLDFCLDRAPYRLVIA